MAAPGELAHERNARVTEVEACRRAFPMHSPENQERGRTVKTQTDAPSVRGATETGMFDYLPPAVVHGQRKLVFLTTSRISTTPHFSSE